MKEIFIATLGFLFLVNASHAQDKGVDFQQNMNWAQVKDKAKRENKFIFVDCFATWCGPCKVMDKNIYPNERIGNYMNGNFISIKMQMDTSREDNDKLKQFYSDASDIMQKYKINVFPTFLFFSPDGNIVHRDMGFKSEEDFMAIAKASMDQNKQYYSLLERYSHGQLDTGYMKSLAHACNSFGDKELAAKIANDYINRQNEEGLYAPDNIWFMVEFTMTSKDRGFSIFRDHADKIHQSVSQIGKENLNAFVENIIYKEGIKPYINSRYGEPDWGRIESNIKKYDSLGEATYRIYKPGIIFKSVIEPFLKKDPTWTRILPLIKRQHAGKGEEFLVGSSIVYYLNNGLVSGASSDCSNFIAAATYYSRNYYSYLTADPLNTWAWTVFQRSSDKKELNRALAWSDSCLKLSSKADANYFDTYANLLYKLGKSNEAIAWEKKAVKLAPEDKAILDNFGKMKRGENTWGNSE